MSASEDRWQSESFPVELLKEKNLEIGLIRRIFGTNYSFVFFKLAQASVISHALEFPNPFTTRSSSDFDQREKAVPLCSNLGSFASQSLDLTVLLPVQK